jgi:hypothetical protein
MKEELDFRKSSSSISKVGNPQIRAIHNQVLDLERNILQVWSCHPFTSLTLSIKAKGLRTALCVRIVHTSFVEDAVVYVLRVEDVESGLQWSVRRRFERYPTFIRHSVLGIEISLVCMETS